jgi:hypothetical protein
MDARASLESDSTLNVYNQQCRDNLGIEMDCVAIDPYSPVSADGQPYRSLHRHARNSERAAVVPESVRRRLRPALPRRGNINAPQSA